jgi:hypothetical protein
VHCRLSLEGAELGEVAAGWAQDLAAVRLTILSYGLEQPLWRSRIWYAAWSHSVVARLTTIHAQARSNMFWRGRIWCGEVEREVRSNKREVRSSVARLSARSDPVSARSDLVWQGWKRDQILWARDRILWVHWARGRSIWGQGRILCVQGPFGAARCRGERFCGGATRVRRSKMRVPQRSALRQRRAQVNSPAPCLYFECWQFLINRCLELYWLWLADACNSAKCDSILLAACSPCFPSLSWCVAKVMPHLLKWSRPYQK